MTHVPDDIPHTDEIQDPNLGSTGVVANQLDSPLGPTGNDVFTDTFYSVRNKRYMDFLGRQMTKLRGTDAVYYVLKSQTQRMDGDTPVDVKEGLAPLDPIRHSGGDKGISAMYGEPVIVGNRIDSCAREVTPSWSYADPVNVRVVISEVPSRAEEIDERGMIYTNELVASISRVLCEETWNIKPEVGDVVQLPTLLEGYFDVREVDTNRSRFGATGFFVSYDLTLARTSKFVPQRKLPESHLTPPPEPGA
jgi:hypothetical protein